MYQALYRKWRPQVFSDVVGQEHITKTLMNEITSNRHSHAYLFTGSRGTGKTTCAKIFAKAVNCEHPINGDPCNECETCKGIDNGSILDVIEIDAASNNGVDNIRDIRDEANFTPVNGRYRVYIIDEAHMLSSAASNALLKTLEEPPEHVKFILATTEVHAILPTILSRCQRFDFRRITSNDISKRLEYVAKMEGLTLDEEASMLIARLADGALRDALSILDQCVSRTNNITVDVVNEAVGLAGKVQLFELSKHILENDTASALSKINEFHNKSYDMERLCDELMNHFRNIMICRAVKNPTDLVVCSEQELEEYKSIAAGFEMSKILETLNVLSETKANLRRGYGKRVEMEMAMVRLCNGEYAAEVVVTPVVMPTAKPVIKQTPVVVEPAPVTVTEVPTPTTVSEAPAPVTEQIPVPDDAPPPASEMEQIPEPAAPIVEEATVEPEFPSPGEDIPDGPLDSKLWNALTREVCSEDKIFTGALSLAKAIKDGETLKIYTSNIILKNFGPQKEHNDVIYNATFTVLGTYLRPIILDEEEEVKTAAPEMSDTPAQVSTPAPEEDPLSKFVSDMNSFNETEQINFNLFIEE